MTHPSKDTLFELPEPNKTRLELFKEKHSVWTFQSKDPNYPWTAWIFGGCKTRDEAVKRVMRIFDSEGHGKGGYGPTEEDACIDLAKKHNITITL
jgi:hypothetical protein